MTNLENKRLSRIAVSAYFLIGGTAIAVWGVHIPEVEKRLNISHSVIGSIILLFGLGAFLAMQAMGWVIDHYGSRQITAFGGVTTGLGLLVPAYADNVVTLAIGIFVLGACVGILDVGMNANGVVIERSYGRSIFSSLHAMWSVGGILGAIIGGVALTLKSPMWFTLSLTGAAMAIGSILFYAPLAKDKPTTRASSGEKGIGNAKNRKSLGLVLLVGLMACFAAISEGSAVDWSALHITTILSGSPAEGAMAVGGFSAMMAVTRLVGDKLVDRFGRLAIVRYGALLASAGILTAVLATQPWIGILGWSLLGIGVSGIIPQLFIVAGNIGEESHSGRNMAKVFGLTYFGIMAGPAIIGFLTNWIPLNNALSIGAVLCIVVALTAGALRSEKIR